MIHRAPRPDSQPPLPFPIAGPSARLAGPGVSPLARSPRPGGRRSSSSPGRATAQWAPAPRARLRVAGGAALRAREVAPADAWADVRADVWADAPADARPVSCRGARGIALREGREGAREVVTTVLAMLAIGFAWAAVEAGQLNAELAQAGSAPALRLASGYAGGAGSR